MKLIYLKLLIGIYLPAISALFIFSGADVDILKLLLFSGIVVIYGIAWDMWATKHGKVDKLWIWRFNPHTVTGVYIKNHPVDEYVFGLFHLFWLILFWEMLAKALYQNEFILLLVLLLTVIWQMIVAYVFYGSQTKRN